MTAAGNADLEKRMNAPTLFICRSRMLRIVMFAALSWSLFAESGSYDPLAYRTGLASIQALGGDLYHSLGATERTLVSSSRFLSKRRSGLQFGCFTGRMGRK